MKKTILPGLVALVLGGSLAVALAAGEGARTVQGEFTWNQRSAKGDLEAVFTPTGDGTWDVAFHFTFRDKAHVYSGIAQGLLSGGELKGTVQNENGDRKFLFQGLVENGQFRGSHSEVEGGDAVETGSLTLHIPD